MENQVRILRRVGVAEGISFLVLLLVAMPLKHFFNMPLAVKLVGWAHGVLFIAYLAVVIFSIRALKMKSGEVFIAVIAGFLPFGTLVLDRSWKNRELIVRATQPQG